MVDRILEWQPRQRIVGVKAVSFEEYSLRSCLECSTGVPPVSRMGVSPMQRGLGNDALESARAATVLCDKVQFIATTGETPVGHMGGTPMLHSTAALPESLLMESLFQLGNWLIVLSSDFTRMGLLVRVEEVAFYEPLRPGQSLRMDVEVTRYREDGIAFNGIATAAGRPIASGKGCLATPVDLADFHNPDDLKVLFSEIYAT
ncbi:MAG: hypothetical protein FWE88_08810 [Phycisphaerae bacterium]|nr:hypothetical protein [Phycisphaerae bacterium]